MSISTYDIVAPLFLLAIAVGGALVFKFTDPDRPKKKDDSDSQ